MPGQNFETPQEEFWAGDFGNNYIKRNKGEQLIAGNLNLFSKVLRSTEGINSCLEFGANIGLNLRALKLLSPEMQQYAVEINNTAADELAAWLGDENVFRGSIYDYPTKQKVDLAFIKTVLIHINPERLHEVYQKLYKASKRYILIAEYYNPAPVQVNYRGHTERLFKRDFAGEMLDKYKDLELVDYGFSYHRDPNFPQDDISWFLLKKKD